MEENQNQQIDNSTSPVSQFPQTPPAPNPPPSGSKFKFSLKAIIGTVIFLLLAGGAAASFMVFRPQILKLVSKPASAPTPTIIKTPTPTLSTASTPAEIANWKSYDSQSLDGFKLKYPSTLEPTDEYGKAPLLVTFNATKKADSQKPNELQPYFSIYIITTYAGSSARDFVNDPNHGYIFVKDIKIGNNDFIFAQEKDKPTLNEYLLQLRSGSIFKVSYPASPQMPELLKTILTTLEFPEATHIDKPIEIPVEPTTIGLTTARIKGDQELSLKISNISSFTSLYYELNYTVETGETRGVIGGIDPPEFVQKNEISRNIILGTCTDKCIYDKGVKNLELTLRLWQKDGKVGIVKKTVEL